MKAKSLIRLQRAVLYALCIQPIGLMFGCGLLPERPLQWWLLPGLHMLAIIPLFFVNGRRRTAAGAAGALLVVVAGLFLLPWKAQWGWLAAMALYFVLTLAAMPVGARQEEISPWMTLSSIAFYLIAQFMCSHFGEPWEHMQTALLASFLVYLLLLMLMLNRISLTNATHGLGGLPQALRRYGLWLTLGMFACTLLVAAIPLIPQALEAVWLGVRRGIALLIEKLFSGGGGTTIGGGPGAGMGGLEGLMEPSEPSLLAVILEKLMGVVVFICLVGIVVLALRALWRMARRMISRTMERLRAFAEASSADYVDEVEDTRTPEDDTSARISLRRRRWGPRKLERLEPRERIRAVYAMLKRRHPDWRVSSTARETLPAEAARLYERARYSEHPIALSEAEAFEQEIHQARKSMEG